jgi:hypothetical protein
VRTPKACEKNRNLSNVFRMKCFWSAMRSRIAFLVAMPARLCVAIAGCAAASGSVRPE